MCEVHTQEELEGLSRKELQSIAKKCGVKANLKSAAIITQLLDYYKEQQASEAESDAEPDQPDPEPEQVPTQPKSVSPLPSPIKQSPTKPETPKQRTPERLVTVPVVASTVKKTLPRNIVPPSPLQKFVRNASSVLTPRKTPLLAKTPIKEQFYIITPRKNKNRKNLFRSPEKLPHLTPKKLPPALSTAPVVDPFEDVDLKDVLPINPVDLYQVLTQLDPSELLLADYAAISFIYTSTTGFLIDILKQAMKEDGISARKGYILKQASLEKALEQVLAGELLENAKSETGIVRKRCEEREDKDSEITPSEIGLTLNYKTVEEFLKKLEISTQTLDDVLAITCCLEYICCEIWHLSEHVEYAEYSVVQLHHVIDAIKSDEELFSLFKDSVTEKEENSNKGSAAVLPGPGSPEDTPATLAEISRLELTLGFKLPLQLKSLFQQRNGDPSIGIDSCSKIEESIITYKEIQVVYTLLNWIPIHNHGDNDVWDCLDVVTGLVVRMSVLPDETEEEIDTGAYPVLAKSLDEYISTYNKEGSVASKDKPHLSDVAPLCAAIAKFWINIAEEEDSVGHE